MVRTGCSEHDIEAGVDGIAANPCSTAADTGSTEAAEGAGTTSSNDTAATGRDTNVHVDPTATNKVAVTSNDDDTAADIDQVIAGRVGLAGATGGGTATNVSAVVGASLSEITPDMPAVAMSGTADDMSNTTSDARTPAVHQPVDVAEIKKEMDMFEGLGDSIYVLAVKALASGAPFSKTYSVYFGLFATFVVQVVLLSLLLTGAGTYPKVDLGTDGQPPDVQQLQQQLCSFLQNTDILKMSANMTAYCNMPGSLNSTQRDASADLVKGAVLVFFVTACAMFTLALFALNEATNACCLGYVVAAHGGFLPSNWFRNEHWIVAGVTICVRTALQKNRLRCNIAAILPILQLVISLLAYTCGMLLMSALQFSTDWVQIVVNSVAAAFVLELDNKIGELLSSPGKGQLTGTPATSLVPIQVATGKVCISRNDV